MSSKFEIVYWKKDPLSDMILVFLCPGLDAVLLSKLIWFPHALTALLTSKDSFDPSAQYSCSPTMWEAQLESKVWGKPGLRKMTLFPRKGRDKRKIVIAWKLNKAN